MPETLLHNRAPKGNVTNVKIRCRHCSQSILADISLLKPDLKCPNCQRSEIIPQAYLPSGNTHKPIARNLWQRWMAWSGSFLVLSIVVHVILIGGATLLVVQVVQRKEKLKFTAPPPRTAGPAEYKVKPSKKTAAAAPALSKRITSSAVNVSVALPAMEMNASTGPDVMASMMSGMGASGLGSGAGGGGAGMASMPVAGLTAFGFKGVTVNAGLSGHIYDLKQTADGKPTDIKDDGELKNPHLVDNITNQVSRNSERWKILNDKSTLGKRADLVTQSVLSHTAVLEEFFSNNWDDKILKRYFQSKDPVISFQFFIPATSSLAALKAFGADKEIKPTHFLIHYKGFVRAPKDGDYRFRVKGSAWVRFDGQNVVGEDKPSNDIAFNRKYFDFHLTDPPAKIHPPPYDYLPGKWFHVEAGKKYPMEVLMDVGSSGCYSCLMIEQRGETYPKRFMSELYPQDPPAFCYPVFAMMKGIPIPPYDKKAIEKKKADIEKAADYKILDRPFDDVPETTPEPLIFPGTK